VLQKVPATMAAEERSIFLRWNDGAEQLLLLLPGEKVV